MAEDITGKQFGAWTVLAESSKDARGNTKQHTWCINPSGYVVTNNRNGQHKLHRLLLQLSTEDDFEVDHIDRDTLNNCRSNLRLCSREQNTHNQGKKGNNTSGHKGVSWDKRVRRWQARIMKEGHSKHLGYFETKEQAAEAYNKAALELHGEFAYINKIEGSDECAETRH